MGNTVSYFLQPHVALVVLAAFGATWLLRSRFHGRPRRVLLFALLVSTGIVVQATLLRDGIPPGVCLECLSRWSFGRAVAGDVGTEVWLNLMLFVPPGLLAMLLWRRPFRVIGAAVLLSVLIETVQSVGIGVADLLDVIANSVGALVGIWLASVLLLVHGLVASKGVHRATIMWVLMTPLVTLAGGWGGSALVATTRQEAIVRQLEEAFAGTTLVDYDRWEADGKLAEMVFSRAPPGRPARSEGTSRHALHSRPASTS